MKLHLNLFVFTLSSHIWKMEQVSCEAYMTIWLALLIWGKSWCKPKVTPTTCFLEASGVVGTLGCFILECVRACVCVLGWLPALFGKAPCKAWLLLWSRFFPLFVSGILSSSAYKKFACELGAWFPDGDHRRRCARPNLDLSEWAIFFTGCGVFWFIQ